ILMSSMKNILFLFLAAVAMVGCNQDEDTPVETTGSVSFVVSGSGGKIAGLTPERLVVSVEDKDGKTIIDSKILNLIPVDQDYRTQDVLLDKGEYRITKYLVISGQTAAYATPKSGAEKAGLIESPLPVEFPVNGSESKTLSPKVVGISSDDVPANFGYSDFGFQVPTPEEDDWMMVRVKLEMILGGILYQNVDAPVVVKAFDANKNLAWQEEYVYVGAEANDLKIKTDYPNYTIEFRKWGATLTQNFKGVDLWEGRVREGSVPLTRVFQTNVQPKKVSQYVTSWSRVVNGAIVMEPVSRVQHLYNNDGKIALIKSSTWNRETQSYFDNSRLEFRYQGGRVMKIETYMAGESGVYSEDNYTYDANGYATHIQHKVPGTGINTDVDLSYQYTDRVVKASYKLSNGNGFEYEMVIKNGSLKTDKSTRGGQLCSDGTFTYDKGVNPLKHLGYTDYLLRNYSISNRLTEDVNYVGCAFPSLIPDAYDYVYDQDGYPLRATTIYRGSTAKTQIDYTYIQ
ncbi:MAG TPA: hypothetical protein VFE50_04455, partial [Cyclobacteriaceae bacterium]|nr:hypothetical protein [Cyclobacteriaceae bacterium]